MIGQIMAALLLIKSKIAHQAGYYLQQGRWHKVKTDKPVPKGAPVASHPTAGGQHAPAKHLTDEEWSKLKLPAGHTSAAHYNKKLDQLKEHSESGNVTAILGTQFGTDTYAKKAVHVANFLLEKHGSEHKVTAGQKAGEHHAVSAANDLQASEPKEPEPKAEPAQEPAADPKTEPAEAPAPKPDPEPAKTKDPEPDAPKHAIPEFQEGKTTSGVKDYYDKVANKLAALADAGDLDGLEAIKTEGMKPNSKGKIGNTWAGKTENSKMLIKYHDKLVAGLKQQEQAVASLSGGAPEEPPAPPKKVLGKLIARKIAEQEASTAHTSNWSEGKGGTIEFDAGDVWYSISKEPDGTFEIFSTAPSSKAIDGKHQNIASVKAKLAEHLGDKAPTDADLAKLEASAPAPASTPKDGNDAASAPALKVPPVPNLSAQSYGFTVNNWAEKLSNGNEEVKGSMVKMVKLFEDQQNKLKNDTELAQVVQFAVDALKLNGWWEGESDPGPKDGDTKQGADGMLVFKDGRWHKQQEPEPASASAPAEAPTGLDAITIPDFFAGDVSSYQANALHAMAVELLDAAKQHGPAGLKGKVIQHKSGPKSGKISVKAAGYTAKHLGGTSPKNSINQFHQFVVDLVQSAGKAKKSPKKKAAPVAPTVGPDGAQSMDSWKQTGPQMGSNDGGKFKDENGVEWYCKFPSDPDVAKSEILASKLYAAAGVAGQDAKLITKGGKVGIASKWAEVSKAASHAELGKADGTASGFAVDAWLGNWDVIGLGLDNLQMDKATGKAVRVDAGGSLHYRAQGGKKAFGNSVIELDSLRDAKINSASAAVFAGLTEADIAASASKLAGLHDATIKILVNTHGPGTQAEKDALAATLIARKNDILAKYPAAAKKKEKKIVFDPTKINAPPSFSNWGGSGKSGPSSKEFLNQANESAVQAILAQSKTGSVEDIENLTFDVLDKDSGLSTKKVKVLEHPSQHVSGYAKQVINEIKQQLNPPKVFRFDGGHPLHAINDSYPAYNGANHSQLKKLGYFIMLGEPGTVKLDDLGLPSITHASGALTQKTYQEEAKAAIAAMPLTQQSAVQSYTGSNYKEMNKSLWSGNPTGAAKSAKEALQTLGHEIKPGTVLSRKLSLSSGDLNALINAKGQILQEPAIMSTSIRPSAWAGNVQLKLHVGPGVKGLWVGYGSKPDGGALSQHASEDEMILPPNTRILILTSKVSNGSDADGFGGGVSHVVEAVILPTGDNQ